MKILPALVLLTALPCAAAPPVISEFMAINHGPSIDDTGA
jgi:hypothetical protein